MTSSHTYRPHTPLLDHECSPELCTRGPREIAHREVPEQFTPHNEGDPHTPTVHWSLEEHDEIGVDGYATSRTVLGVLGLGAELATMSLDELGRYWRALAELEQRGRRITAAGPAPAA